MREDGEAVFRSYPRWRRGYSSKGAGEAETLGAPSGPAHGRGRSPRNSRFCNQDAEAKSPADEDIAGDVAEQVIEKTDIDRAAAVPRSRRCVER
jgi:hypothetical protein